jgi:hypothetical protein
MNCVSSQYLQCFDPLVLLIVLLTGYQTAGTEVIATFFISTTTTDYQSWYCKTPHIIIIIIKKKALRHRTELAYVFKVSIFSVIVDLSLLVLKAEYCSALPFVTSISQLKFQWEN